MKMKETKPEANERDIDAGIDYVYRRDNVERTAAAFGGEDKLLDNLGDDFTAATLEHLRKHYTITDSDVDTVRDKCRFLVVDETPADDDADEAPVAELAALAVARGYYDRIALGRLLTDLHRQPGCDGVSSRSLAMYLAGMTAPRSPAVVMGLAAVLGVDAETILKAVTK
jgi:hypothetical protein